MEKMISQKAKNIPPFLVMDILEKAQDLESKGHDIIHLEVGEPDFDTPLKIKRAAQKAIKENKTHYTHSLGVLQLREAISVFYNKKYNVNISPNQVIVTMGTSAALFLVLSAMLNPGEQVIMGDPCYACYPNFVRFVESVPIQVPVYAENNWALLADKATNWITNKTRAILINSPSNPTGSMLSKQNLINY